MQKKIARLHIDDVPGYGGYARCYQVSPVIFDGGLGYGYVTIVVHPKRDHADADVFVFYADGRGRPAETSMKRRGGSFTPLHCPHESGQHYIDGCFVWALAANGYEIEGYGYKTLPNGLDYDPDDIPDY